MKRPSTTPSAVRHPAGFPASDKLLPKPLLVGRPPRRVNKSVLIPALDTPLDDQALAYFTRYYIDVPRGFPEVAQGYMEQVDARCCSSDPQSILSLTIFALSHALLGRARKSRDALAVGFTNYSRALRKTNLALNNTIEAAQDDVFVAVMLLGFYENAVSDEASTSPHQSIHNMASRCFAHHNGAMSMLRLRRQLNSRSGPSTNLDRVIRRSLIRSLLLRSTPPPAWLLDGSQYGEHGLTLELDRCGIRVTQLRHQASSLGLDSTGFSAADIFQDLASFECLVVEAQTVDDELVHHAELLPPEDWYKTCYIRGDGCLASGKKTSNEIVHVYPSVGHAGMWNRHRILRLVANDVLLKILSALAEVPALGTLTLREEVRSRIECLAEEMCASVPYILGLVQLYEADDDHHFLVGRILARPTTAVKPSMASSLSWPLTMATMVSGIPDRQQSYMKKSLIAVSEIVDVGFLQRIAARFSPSPLPK